MIYILYNGSKVLANDDGTLVDPPDYWVTTPGLLEGIAEAYSAGLTEYVNFTPSTPIPDWGSFLTPFYNPAHAGSPFDVIESKVQQAWLQTTTDQEKIVAMTLRTHWSNCIIGFTNSNIRSVEWLNNSWSYLKYLLGQANVGLSEAETISIESLFSQYNLM